MCKYGNKSRSHRVLKRSVSLRLLEYFRLELRLEWGVSLSCRCLDGGRSTGLEHIWKILNSPTVQQALLGARIFYLFICVFFAIGRKNKAGFQPLTPNCVGAAMLRHSKWQFSRRELKFPSTDRAGLSPVRQLFVNPFLRLLYLQVPGIVYSLCSAAPVQRY